MTTILKRIEFLKKSPLFQGVQEATLEALARQMKMKRPCAGTMLIRRGETSNGLFIIVAGLAKVCITEDGHRMTLAISRFGEVCGEMTLISNEPSDIDFVMDSDGDVLVLSKNDFTTHLAASVELRENMLRILAQRLRQANELIVTLATQDVAGRLRWLLIKLAHDAGGVTDSQGNLSLQQKPTQQELANMIGCARETVSKVYAIMVGKGTLVPSGRRGVVITGVGKLAPKPAEVVTSPAPTLEVVPVTAPLQAPSAMVIAPVTKAASMSTKPKTLPNLDRANGRGTTIF